MRWRGRPCAESVAQEVKKENPSNLLTNQTAGECGLSGPGKNQVWPHFSFYCKMKMIPMELKNHQMIGTEVGFAAVL